MTKIIMEILLCAARRRGKRRKGSWSQIFAVVSSVNKRATEVTRYVYICKYVHRIFVFRICVVLFWLKCRRVCTKEIWIALFMFRHLLFASQKVTSYLTSLCWYLSLFCILKSCVLQITRKTTNDFITIKFMKYWFLKRDFWYLFTLTFTNYYRLLNIFDIFSFLLTRKHI